MDILAQPHILALCLAIALAAGVVKGMVGFAMPMIMISGLSSVIPAETALAGLILPTLATNLWQALRQGPGAAWQVVIRFRLFLGVAFLCLLATAQMVNLLPEALMLALIGLPIVLYAISQLRGRQLRLGHPPARWVEVLVAMLAGGIGGFSGVWGPPTVAYLTALDTPKAEQVQVQGVIYGLASVALMGAHISSGVIGAETLPFSLALVPVALVGMWIGFRIHDRIDQRRFRQATLVVLLVAGLNLIRRAASTF